MQDFEKLGVFYLGRRYDLEAGRAADDLVLYDSKDLVTHALCVGMTGSGKTGLGISLIEEAAIDGVPAIVIDPKGDLSNLLLTFPDLSRADFLPWVDEDDAARAGKPVPEFADHQALRWKNGLAEWGQDGDRIRRLRDAAEFTIYTPGSTAGVPVSALGSFDRPETDDPELLSELVQTTVSGLLALAGVDADPIKSREHILLATILRAAWQAGESPDLATLVRRLLEPPIARIGVLDVDAFFPPQDRFAFAGSINAVLASPGFESWMTGDPLDVSAFLRTPAGKPRVSIFSIAHLDDSQRMFFVSLLLNAVVAWMRTQSGTSSLRALLYVDEIHGFFPPVSSPPSKPPMLTLLKQARAFGVGVVLATQNPADLDYKGLGNIGTWWLGRLQTERDKARLVDGLEGASAGGGIERAELDRLLSSVPARVFLMRNVHDDALTVFQSRWALSYLRGPLGRDGIKRLMAGRRRAEAPPAVPGAPVAAAGASGPRPSAPTLSGTGRPTVPPDVPQYFASSALTSNAPLRPVVYGAADVRFVDPKLKVDTTRTVALAAAVTDGAVPVDWQDAARVEFLPDALERRAPDAAAQYHELPAAASKARNYPVWQKQLAAWIAANEELVLLRSPSTGGVSMPDESERDFRARLQQSWRESRDRATDALRKKYASKQAALDERLRRAEQAAEREKHQAAGQRIQTVVSVGATLVSAFLGRRAISTGTIGRATTAARGVGRSMKESQDVGRAQETVTAVQEQRQRLDSELLAETTMLEAGPGPAGEEFESIALKPKKANVTVRLVALVWTES